MFPANENWREGTFVVLAQQWRFNVGWPCIAMLCVIMLLEPAREGQLLRKFRFAPSHVMRQLGYLNVIAMSLAMSTISDRRRSSTCNWEQKQ